MDKDQMQNGGAQGGATGQLEKINRLPQPAIIGLVLEGKRLEPTEATVFHTLCHIL